MAPHLRALQKVCLSLCLTNIIKIFDGSMVQDVCTDDCWYHTVADINLTVINA